ncbi:MAG: hypothetical protein HYZ57_13715, partial [Acidobacteria bacterium]|nr:hypothetical protein [Acidobacteriota bacterium]
YSVNGGPEKVVPLLGRRGVKKGAGETLIALEDFKLVPGDVVSLYASARDARSTTKTDIAFIEAQPFEKEYQQAQTMGMGGGGGDPQEQISQRQKEIIAATFNQIRDRSGDKGAAAENARFLSEIQSKLRDQAQSLARRMRARQLSGASQEFQAFANDMEKAAQAMTESAGKLKQQKWQEALAPQQKSLQGLLRAESTFRQIQVAFGRQGGGGGGGGAGRDLESLFDLELDTEKNQYETGQQTASADDRQREVDEALQKLEQLARRQQELARQRDQKNQTPQQRWQQEMLRREAEQLQKRMQELAQGNRSQSSSQQQGSQSSSQSSQGSQSGQQMSGRGGQSDPRLQRAIERLQRASDDMRRAASPQAGLPQQGAAEARRAADRLQEARDALRGMQAQNSGRQIDQLAGRAEQLAAQQRDFAERLKKAFPNNQSPPSMFNRQPGQSAQQAEQFASEKERMAEELARLEREMHSAARNMQGSERGASSKLRDALGQMQQDELLLRMRFNAGYIRQGWGGMLGGRETQITAGMDKLRDQIKQAQKALGPGDEGNNTELEKALARVERLREQLERATGARDGRDQQGRQGQGRQGQQQAQSGAQGEQGGPQGRQGQPGQQGQRGQQPGQGREGERGVESGRQYGGGPRSPYGIQGIYRSPDWIPGQGPTRNADPEQAYREGVRELSQLRQQLRDDADLSRDLQELMREMQRFEAGKLAGNPIILQQMRSELIPAIEQLELQLRRKLDQQSGGDVRSSTAERIPPGYAQAVAEYYKRLSKGK